MVDGEDNGVGIPPDMLPHVFDMFAQVNRTLDRAQGGLGIGLSLVQSPGRAARRLGRGRQRRPGPGQHFTVRLPTRIRRPMAPPSRRQRARVPGYEARARADRRRQTPTPPRRSRCCSNRRAPTRGVTSGRPALRSRRRVPARGGALRHRDARHERLRGRHAACAAVRCMRRPCWSRVTGPRHRGRPAPLAGRRLRLPPRQAGQRRGGGRDPVAAARALMRAQSTALGTVVMAMARMQWSRRCGSSRSRSIALARSRSMLSP